MVSWLVGDPVGRTFLVLPIFSACMLAFGAVRAGLRRSPSPLVAPVLHAAVVVGVLVAWCAGAAGAGGLVDERLGLGLAATVAVVAVGPGAAATYLAELWISDRVGELRRRWSTGTPARSIEQLQLVSAGLAAGAAGGGGGGSGVAALTNPMRSAEAFDVVRRISRRPGWFLAISLVTATAEELLYRVAMLDGVATSHGAAVAVVVQAAAYAANHLPFGVPAFVGKLVLGVLLGVVVVATGSVVPALVGHGCFQFLVYRRLRRLDPCT